MAGMRELANHVIAVANKKSLPVTNLLLQKVMFFALGIHLAQNGIDELAKATYDLPFKKWKLGPVVESIYYTFNKYGSSEIKEDGEYSSTYSKWDDVISSLLLVDPFVLVNISHSMSAWANHEDDILNRRYVWPYTLDEIKGDFEKWIINNN